MPNYWILMPLLHWLSWLSLTCYTCVCVYIHCTVYLLYCLPIILCLSSHVHHVYIPWLWRLSRTHHLSQLLFGSFFVISSRECSLAHFTAIDSRFTLPHTLSTRNSRSNVECIFCAPTTSPHFPGAFVYVFPFKLGWQTQHLHEVGNKFGKQRLKTILL